MTIKIDLEKPYWWVVFPSIAIGVGRRCISLSFVFLFIRIDIYNRHPAKRLINLPYVAICFGCLFHHIQLDVYITKKYQWFIYLFKKQWKYRI